MITTPYGFLLDQINIKLSEQCLALSRCSINIGYHECQDFPLQEERGWYSRSVHLEEAEGRVKVGGEGGSDQGAFLPSV